MCDQNNDGALSDIELNEFQVCINYNLPYIMRLATDNMIVWY
jgi:hypothetical protein